MKEKLGIYIPSRGRADTLTTPFIIPKRFWPNMRIVVRKDELREYRAANPGLKFKVLPPGVEGLSATRQWILDHATERLHCQLDDDIVHFCYKPDCKVFGGVRRLNRVRRLNHASTIEAAFDLLCRWITREGFSHVGLAERFIAARPSKLPHYENNKFGQFMLFDLKVMRKLRIRFDRVKLAQDYDVNLQLLAAGCRSRVYTKVSYVSTPEGRAGGVSLYRTEKLRLKVFKQLKRLHRGYVDYGVKHKFGKSCLFIKTSWRKIPEVAVS